MQTSCSGGRLKAEELLEDASGIQLLQLKVADVSRKKVSVTVDLFLHKKVIFVRTKAVLYC